MARVKFALPSQIHVYQVDLEVRVSDLNYGAHLGNDRVLTLCHEARVKWLKGLGLAEVGPDGSGLIMADAMIMYQGEAFLGDLLRIDIYNSESSERSFDLYYQLTRVSDERAIARVKGAMLFFDYHQRKLTRATSEYLQKITSPFSPAAKDS